MRVKKIFGRKWPAFTLTELLISLAVYLIAMTGVVSIIAMSAGMLETFSKGYSSRASAVMACKYLESLMNSTCNLTEETGGSILAKTLDGRNIRLSAESNLVRLQEVGPDGMVREKKLFIRDTDAVSVKLIGQAGRKALCLVSSSKGTAEEKVFLTAYMKTGENEQ